MSDDIPPEFQTAPPRWLQIILNTSKSLHNTIHKLNENTKRNTTNAHSERKNFNSQNDKLSNSSEDTEGSSGECNSSLHDSSPSSSMSNHSNQESEPSLNYAELQYLVNSGDFNEIRNRIDKMTQEQKIITQTEDKNEIDDVPYHRQGNANMYDPENIITRIKNRQDSRMNKALERWWSSLKKNKNNTVSKSTFISLAATLACLLLPHTSYSDAINIAEQEWEQQPQHDEDEIEKSTLLDGLFSLADLWCETCRISEYEAFLDSLHKYVFPHDPPYPTHMQLEQNMNRRSDSPSQYKTHTQRQNKSPLPSPPPPEIPELPKQIRRDVHPKPPLFDQKPNSSNNQNSEKKPTVKKDIQASQKTPSPAQEPEPKYGKVVNYWEAELPNYNSSTKETEQYEKDDISNISEFGEGIENSAIQSLDLPTPTAQPRMSLATNRSNESANSPLPLDVKDNKNRSRGIESTALSVRRNRNNSHSLSHSISQGFTPVNENNYLTVSKIKNSGRSSSLERRYMPRVQSPLRRSVSEATFRKPDSSGSIKHFDVFRNKDKGNKTNKPKKSISNLYNHSGKKVSPRNIFRDKTGQTPSHSDSKLLESPRERQHSWSERVGKMVKNNDKMILEKAVVDRLTERAELGWWNDAATYGNKILELMDNHNTVNSQQNSKIKCQENVSFSRLMTVLLSSSPGKPPTSPKYSYTTPSVNRAEPADTPLSNEELSPAEAVKELLKINQQLHNAGLISENQRSDVNEEHQAVANREKVFKSLEEHLLYYDSEDQK
eukprot:gb/GECH01006627.1/.p1 GENE.gb/GECH01006627.1/~~gb/GECH01006627.1/.p1  ORF type:complete len:775 (+),score=183.11 gb/GECH01006627.1/:1-2325(+)